MEKEVEHLVNNLKIFKDEFIKDKEQLKVSIRRDVVIAELKDIIKNNTDYENMKLAITDLINELYSIGGK